MRGGVAIALIAFGVCLILGALLANIYTSNRDKERVAEFYTRNSNLAPLPTEMRPSGPQFYDLGCFLAGATMVGIGVMRSRALLPGHSA